MNRSLYSLLLYFISPLLLLYLGFRAIKSADYRGRWSERFGFAKLQPSDVVIHSVSMGETLAAIPLIKLIMQQHPELQITVTTTSPTGSAQVRKAFGDTVQHCYLPFDLPYSIKRFLAQIQPQSLIIMETELWPNLLHYAAKRGCRCMLANGRLSAKSAAQYHKRLKLVQPMLACLDYLALQTEAEAQRFIELGVNANKISVCGSLKFDLNIADTVIEQAQQLRSGWQRNDAPIWVAGSVHPGEFQVIIDAHKQLLERHPNALLVVVPRHPEQFDAAAQLLATNKLKSVRRSSKQALMPDTQVLLGDSMGELLLFYAAADYALVGGSLIVHGGHNPLEPAALAKPVLMGPNYRDFLQITEMLQTAGGLTVVDDAEAIAKQLIGYIEQPEMSEQVGQAALNVVAQNRGALQQQFAVVEQLFHITKH
ncbi:lipid IV(A) 3-deoxy-D-manno-octulosonic acid transferase [Shewanella marina]|uniref:lipid IV(A) 3-deoxy-D-manno-octulosonic acid transferase n=1 Tax=Shewanella marina TaxID=487319 RepID=UPI00046E6FDF|nr:lipid IV(A) 3-deoxy-D-manno-octulosonic acid transferase [Shewanella marina]